MQGGRSETVGGQFMNRNVQPFISFQGPWQSFARLGVVDRKEYWNGVTYDMNSAFMFGQFRPRSGLNINMQINRGEQIDYTNSRLADQRRYQPQIDWNATRHLLVRLRYTSDHLSSQGRRHDIQRQADGLAAHVAVQRAQLRALDAAGSGHRAQRRAST